jgi:ActR/RegA family two-component response regulator
MTGVGLAGEILGIREDMPIVMCAGFSHLVEASKARAAGGHDYFMKPRTSAAI